MAASRDAGTSRCVGASGERVAFAQIEFATDSTLEGNGFGLLVPRHESPGFRLRQMLGVFFARREAGYLDEMNARKRRSPGDAPMSYPNI